MDQKTPAAGIRQPTNNSTNPAFNTPAWWERRAPTLGELRLRGMFPNVDPRYIAAKLRSPRSIQPGIDFSGGNFR